MQREQLYNKTVDILVQGYFDDTLEHLNPCGCAVGNIIAANCGIKLGIINPTYASKIGPLSFLGDNRKLVSLVLENNGLWFEERLRVNPIVKEQISRTGYSLKELLLIEKAFEHHKYDNPQDAMFNGLMAVIKTLDKIHENTNEEITQQSKNKFKKQCQKA